MKIFYVLIMMLGVVVFVLGCITIGWTLMERING